MNKSSRFFEAVGRNKRIRRMHRMRESGVWTIDTDKYIAEIEGLHATRMTRHLVPKKLLAASKVMITEVSLQSSAFRSRIVEIRMVCFKAKRLLDKHLKAATNYLTSKYAPLLRVEFSTISAKDKAVSYVLEDFYQLREDLQTVIEIADMVITDIDQSGWRVRDTIAALEIHSHDK